MLSALDVPGVSGAPSPPLITQCWRGILPHTNLYLFKKAHRRRGGGLLCVFIWAEESAGCRPEGFAAAQRLSILLYLLIIPLLLVVSSSLASSPASHHPAEERDGRGGQRRHDLLRGRGRAAARHLLEESQRRADLRGRRQGRNWGGALPVTSPRHI